MVIAMNSHSHLETNTHNPHKANTEIDFDKITNPMLKAALAYRRAGFSLIPVSRRSKVPAGSLLPQVADPTRPKGMRGTWKPFQKQLPTEEMIRGWFSASGSNSSYNIALICGAVSGGLVVLDFDEDASAHFANWAEQVGPLVQRLTIARSSRGLHVYFRCKDPGKSCVLAASESGQVFIEARAGGGMITAPPSVHNSGAVYRWCQGDQTTIPFLTQPAVECLLTVARRLDERPPKQYPSTVDIPENVPAVDLDEKKWQRLKAYAAKVLSNAHLELAMAKGQRNNTLNLVAFRLASYAAASLLTQAEIEAQLLTACGLEGNRLIVDDGEAAFWATLRSGYEAGLLNPQDLQALWWRLEQQR